MDQLPILKDLVPAVAIALIFAVQGYFIARESGSMHKEKTQAFLEENKRKDEMLEQLMTTHLTQCRDSNEQLVLSNQKMIGAIEKLSLATDRLISKVGR